MRTLPTCCAESPPVSLRHTWLEKETNVFPKASSRFCNRKRVAARGLRIHLDGCT